MEKNIFELALLKKETKLFLSLCSKEDKERLLHKRKMSAEDLDRLSFIADMLGLRRYETELLWSFPNLLEEVEKEERGSLNDKEAQELLKNCDRWAEEFFNQIPNKYLKRKYRKTLGITLSTTHFKKKPKTKIIDISQWKNTIQ